MYIKFLAALDMMVNTLNISTEMALYEFVASMYTSSRLAKEIIIDFVSNIKPNKKNLFGKIIKGKESRNFTTKILNFKKLKI